MRNQLLPNPPSIIQAAPTASMEEMILFAQKQQNFSSQEELINYISHHFNNIKHDNGRIYMAIDKNGQLFAHSVSPYSINFFNNIEPGVKKLVNILRKKRYLTYSSCEGHGNSFRRYVGLAFANEESREVVVQYIKSLKIKGIILKKFNTVSNQNASFSNNKLNYNQKIIPTDLEGEELKKHKENETFYFNVSFHRKYEDYCFLEIIILEEITEKMYLRNPFKYLWLLFMKKYKWDKITQKLVIALEDKSFPKYKY